MTSTKSYLWMILIIFDNYNKYRQKISEKYVIYMIVASLIIWIKILAIYNLHYGNI